MNNHLEKHLVESIALYQRKYIFLDAAVLKILANSGIGIQLELGRWYRLSASTADNGLTKSSWPVERLSLGGNGPSCS